METVSATASRPKVGCGSVHDDVRFTGEDRPGVIRCGHADGIDPAHLARLAPRLGVAIDHQIHQFQLRMIDDRSTR